GLNHIPVPEEAMADRVTHGLDTPGFLKVGPKKDALGVGHGIADAARAVLAIRLREEMRPARDRQVVIEKRLGMRGRRDRTPCPKNPENQNGREDSRAHVSTPILKGARPTRTLQAIRSLALVQSSQRSLKSPPSSLPLPTLRLPLPIGQFRNRM